MKRKDLLIISCLRQDARMKLTDMSKLTKIPVSTIFDRIRLLEGNGIVKNTALVRFDLFGYWTKAIITFSAGKKERQKLQDLLERCENVNSLCRINNGWDFLIEAVFRNVKEVEDFVEGVEEKVKLKDRKIFYVIEELGREEFMSSPEKERIIKRVIA